MHSRACILTVQIQTPSNPQPAFVGQRQPASLPSLRPGFDSRRTHLFFLPLCLSFSLLSPHLSLLFSSLNVHSSNCLAEISLLLPPATVFSVPLADCDVSPGAGATNVSSASSLSQVVTAIDLKSIGVTLAGSNPADCESSFLWQKKSQGTAGLEPATSRSAVECSTTELSTLLSHCSISAFSLVA